MALWETSHYIYMAKLHSSSYDLDASLSLTVNLMATAANILVLKECC